MAPQHSVQVKAEHNYLETMHKGSQLKEVCELPFVMLCDEDEKALFDIGVQLKFGDFKNVLGATQKLTSHVFHDFPPEVFLQRTDIFRALTDLLEGSQGSNVYTNLAQPALLVFLQRMRTLYDFVCNNANKVSHVNSGLQPLPLEPYLEHCYPCNHNGKWQVIDDIKDINRYGGKTAAMSAATLSNSLSCKSAIAVILTKAIYLLKDTEKLGLYVQLIEEALDILLYIFRVKGNEEFSEILHLCLFSFDSVSHLDKLVSIGLRVLQRRCLR